MSLTTHASNNTATGHLQTQLKKEEIPDEDNWISRKIRVFANTGNV